jgi:hypothetical protein
VQGEGGGARRQRGRGPGVKARAAATKSAQCQGSRKGGSRARLRWVEPQSPPKHKECSPQWGHLQASPETASSTASTSIAALLSVPSVRYNRHHCIQMQSYLRAAAAMGADLGVRKARKGISTLAGAGSGTQANAGSGTLAGASSSTLPGAGSSTLEGAELMLGKHLKSANALAPQGCTQQYTIIRINEGQERSTLVTKPPPCLVLAPPQVHACGWPAHEQHGAPLSPRPSHGAPGHPSCTPPGHPS